MSYELIYLKDYYIFSILLKLIMLLSSYNLRMAEMKNVSNGNSLFSIIFSYLN